MAVQPGDQVTAGQVLVQADSKAVEVALRDAQDSLDTTRIRTAAAQRQVTTVQQDALAAATDALRRAQTNYAKVAAGASDSEKQGAENGVTNAQIVLRKAQEELARLRTPPSASEIQAAEQAVTAARVAAQVAEADAQQVQSGPSAADLRNAEQQGADAQLAVTQAQSDLARLQAGPDAVALRTAQRDVERARTAVDAATSVKDQLPTAVAQAKLSLQDAQDRLDRLRQPAPTEMIDAAKNKLEAAKVAAANAQDHLNSLRRGPDQLTIDKNNAAVGGAKLALEQAQAKLDSLRAGPSQDVVQAAQEAVQSGQAQFELAEADRDRTYARPTQAELHDAESQVAAAQKALQSATTGQGTDSQSDNQVPANRELQKTRDQVAELQNKLEATRLRAPFDGRVVSVSAAPGQSIDGGTPAVVLAKSGAPIVEAALPAPTGDGQQDAQIGPGMRASIILDQGDGAALSGTVVSITDASESNLRLAQLRVDWDSAAPRYGATALVMLTVQQKPDALLVPSSAVHTAGTDKYVEYVDGSQRRIQRVTVGVSSDTDVEILSGLSEGQSVAASTSTL